MALAAFFYYPDVPVAASIPVTQDVIVSDRLGCDESELICTGSTPVKIDYKIIGK